MLNRIKRNREIKKLKNMKRSTNARRIELYDNYKSGVYSAEEWIRRDDLLERMVQRYEEKLATI